LRIGAVATIGGADCDDDYDDDAVGVDVVDVPDGGSGFAVAIGAEVIGGVVI